MKRLLIIAFILLFAGTSPAGTLQTKQAQVLAKKNATPALTCLPGASPGWSNTQANDYFGLVVDETSNYQEVANSEQKAICKIDATMWVQSDTVTVHVELWDTSKATQYGSDSSDCTITDTSDPGSVCTFTFATNPEPPGDFRIYFIPTGGTGAGRLNVSTSNSYFGGAEYDVFLVGGEHDDDATITIYYMQ